MPVAIDATVSGANANAYGLVADATTYFNTQLFSVAFLGAANDDIRAQGLIEATNLIDLEQYQGDVASLTQRLKWPRTYVLQPFDPGIVVPPGAMPPAGYVPLPRYYSSTTIIRPVFESMCELANILIAAKSLGVDPFGEDITLLIKSERLGPMATDYIDPQYRRRGIWRYPKVAARLGPLVIGARQQRVVRA